MCIYKISFIRVYLSIYCLQPAGCIFIKSYFFATTSTTNHHHHLTNQPTTDQVFCLHLQRSIRSFYIFHIQPSTMITKMINHQSNLFYIFNIQRIIWWSKWSFHISVKSFQQSFVKLYPRLSLCCDRICGTFCSKPVACIKVPLQCCSLKVK